MAIIDRGEADHVRCVAALQRLRGPLVTTWPAFTEAMYLLGAAAGWAGQAPLWRMVAHGHLQLVETTPTMLNRLPVLMEKYRDLPMDLADASLVAYAEERALDRIFTLDRDFQVYRLSRGKSFVVLP